MTQLYKNQPFTISHADASPFVTRGRVVFEYEGSREQGGGEHMLRAGSCVLQPPGIRHREIRHSDDMELIEITSPADFATTDAN